LLISDLDWNFKEFDGTVASHSDDFDGGDDYFLAAVFHALFKDLCRDC